MKHVLFVFFSFYFLLSNAQTFSITVNQTIPDDGTSAIYNITISGLQNTTGQTFGFEELCINLTHTYNSDLEAQLQSPDGTIVTLFDNVGDDGDNFTNTCISKKNVPAISGGSAPFNGNYKAMGDLGLLNNGQNPNGIWKLILRDNYAADIGFLQNFRLSFSNTPALPFVFTSSNLPLIKITTNNVSIPNDPKVEAVFQIIDNQAGNRNYLNDTNYAYSGNIMIELQGFSGPSYPKKNYDFDLIDAVQNKIDTPLLGMPSENDWILKAEYLDVSLMANPLTYELARRMGIYAPRTRYCEVFVNDEYVGVYSLTEKVKRGEKRVNIAKLKASDTTGIELTGGYIIEMNINGDPAAWYSQYAPINSATHSNLVEFKEVYPKQNEIAPQQHNYIKNFVDSFEFALQNNNLDRNKWREFAAEKSFIDFQLVNEFSVNYDSYGRSTYMYKEKVTDGNKLHIGPPWDYDRAYAAGTETGWVWEQTHLGWPFPFWWSKFNSDSTYLNKLYCRWTTLRTNTLSNDSFNLFIYSTSAYLQEAATRNFEKWTELGVTDYTNSTSDFRTFINTRLAWMDANILSFGATIPTLQISDTTLCMGESIDGYIGNEYSYKWSTDDTNSIFTPTQTDNYLLKVSDIYNCSISEKINVKVNNLPNPIYTTTLITDLNYNFVSADSTFTNYLWNFGTSFFDTVKTPNYTYDTSGIYYTSLTVTDTNGCSNTRLDTLLISISNIEQNQASTIKISPNPFHDFITVSSSETMEEITLELTNVIGKEIYKTRFINSTTIKTDLLPKGIYFISLKWQDKLDIKKLIKQ